MIRDIFLTSTVLFLLVMIILWRTSSSTEEFIFVWVPPIIYAMCIPIAFIITIVPLIWVQKRFGERTMTIVLVVYVTAMIIIFAVFLTNI